MRRTAQNAPKICSCDVWQRRRSIRTGVFIVGIAMDALDVKGSSEDFICLDTNRINCTEEIQKAQQMRSDLGYFKVGNAVLPLSEDEYPASRKAVDVPKLAEELSGLTVSESVELAEMLKAKWSGPDPPA